ncbi:MAG: ferritin-like domain-containing protein [Verrucomicrobiae bacterium]|nr:ferritin-like domain-containing protein [Verrucomicrobiae bacterium]
MIQDLNELYQDQIRDIYNAETQLIEALPKMAAAATDEDLRKAFQDHLEETRQQRARLEKIAARRGFSPDGETCDAMRGLIKEGEKHKGETAGGAVRDAVLIASANRVEHYEIAAYGVARTFANVLGFDDDVSLLDESLDEESDADDKVTKIATGGLFGSGVNQAAAN